MNRQQRWQKKKVEAGLCRECGKEAFPYNYCQPCRDKHNGFAKRYYWRKKNATKLARTN